MGQVLLDENRYRENLETIQKGFVEGNSLHYDSRTKSTLSSMVAIHSQVMKIDRLIKSYMDALSGDVKECVKIGNVFTTIDEAYRKALINGDKL